MTSPSRGLREDYCCQLTSACAPLKLESLRTPTTICTAPGITKESIQTQYIVQTATLFASKNSDKISERRIKRFRRRTMTGEKGMEWKEEKEECGGRY